MLRSGERADRDRAPGLRADARNPHAVLRAEFIPGGHCIDFQRQSQYCHCHPGGGIIGHRRGLAAARPPFAGAGRDIGTLAPAHADHAGRRRDALYAALRFHLVGRFRNRGRLAGGGLPGRVRGCGSSGHALPFRDGGLDGALVRNLPDPGRHAAFGRGAAVPAGAGALPGGRTGCAAHPAPALEPPNCGGERALGVRLGAGRCAGGGAIGRRLALLAVDSGPLWADFARPGLRPDGAGSQHGRGESVSPGVRRTGCDAWLAVGAGDLVPVIKKLILTRNHWQAMRRHVARRAPLEACGLLGGKNDQVEITLGVRNADRSPLRFRMEARAQWRAFRQIEDRGLELVGIYHSHPNGPAYPSPTDVAEAMYPVVQVVWWLEEGAKHSLSKWQARGFWIEGGRVSEVALQVINPE
ncbi:MAG: hypothetical protein COS63_00500 [Anaerolineae bacterium CG06_land_8_20_14_3_00_57_67]|nr:MAG: hypothetical protein COS63_00500 [Anaerolineae bacterium CG06_land_8_20_14_3_00_57_67]PIX47460.1 MAG: hypothetical protein COZ54_01260 [Anaerolineae bacterium CG_4_8_14_3_um_filter_59_70]